MSSFFNNIFTVISKILEIRRVNPHIKVGLAFMGLAVTLLGGGVVGKLFLSNKDINFFIEINTDSSSLIMLLGVILLIIGIILCFIGLNNTKRVWAKKVFYYLIGLENQQEKAPFGALPKMAKWYPPHLVVLKAEYENVLDNLKYNIKTISNRIDQSQTNDVFWGGLARVPYLFFIGYAFRNAHSTINLLEHNHKTTKWFTLKDIDDSQINLIVKNNLKDKRYIDIGIIIEFTCKIPITDIPEKLRNNSIRIKLNTKISHNQITSQKTLDRVVDDIVQELIKVSKKCDTIHLFISAQSTVIFSLGRRYQNGMIGNIKVYNYNPIIKGYDWSIGLINNELIYEDTAVNKGYT